jgi:hypothetical protein
MCSGLNQAVQAGFRMPNFVEINNRKFSASLSAPQNMLLIN